MIQNQRKGTGAIGAWNNGGIFTKTWDGEWRVAVVVVTRRGWKKKVRCVRIPLCGHIKTTEFF